ncbi:MAG: glycosyltransferase family 2 protein [Candidatus Dormibacteraeota bacterium]|nr:glycosyltransferase family 2 protein [Candidatus Dormibacteraeota bacterium]
MYKGKTIQVILPALDEAGKIGKAVERIPGDIVDVVVVVDDGSTDGTAAEARAAGATVLVHPVNQGVGAAIRTGIYHAQKTGVDLCGIIAGDDQDRPDEIVRLGDAIIDGGADFIQGSRYVPGGERLNQPTSRTAMTRSYSVFFSACVGKRITDATNGFKLFRTEVTRNMHLDQPWLNRYELEPYLLFSAIKMGLDVREVPVTKYYPPDRQVGYTKMKAYRDWWGISRPMLLLALRIRK